MSAVKNPEYPDLSQVGYSQTKLNIEHISKSYSIPHWNIVTSINKAATKSDLADHADQEYIYLIYSQIFIDCSTVLFIWVANLNTNSFN